MSPTTNRNGQLGDRIVRDRQICGGEPVFKGTRVLLRTVLASLADGDSVQDILTAFPTLESEHVRAAIAFAAASAEEDFRNEAVSTWTRCFVVVTEQKIRVRRGPK